MAFGNHESENLSGGLHAGMTDAQLVRIGVKDGGDIKPEPNILAAARRYRREIVFLNNMAGREDSKLLADLERDERPVLERRLNV